MPKCKKNIRGGRGNRTHQGPFPSSQYLKTLFHFITYHLPSSTVGLGGLGCLQSGQQIGAGRGGGRLDCLPEPSEPSYTSGYHRNNRHNIKTSNHPLSLP